MGGAGAYRFLIDVSAAARIRRPGVVDAWREELRQGRVGMCDPTEIELLYSARSADECEALSAALNGLYTWYPVPADAWSQAKALQCDLAKASALRSARTAPLLVAVTARHHGLTLLHYDQDFEVIAKVADLDSRWLMEPGS